MSDFDASSSKVVEWLQPRTEEGAPCGPDLEYDNDFLALNQAAAGKPETQFAPAEAPDWRAAFDLAGTLLDRSRDLRIAIVWLRAGMHLHGFGFLPLGLRLLSGFVESMWDHVHPLPDPDDGIACKRSSGRSGWRPDGPATWRRCRPPVRCFQFMPSLPHCAPTSTRRLEDERFRCILEQGRRMAATADRGGRALWS